MIQFYHFSYGLFEKIVALLHLVAMFLSAILPFTEHIQCMSQYYNLLSCVVSVLEWKKPGCNLFDSTEK